MQNAECKVKVRFAPIVYCYAKTDNYKSVIGGAYPPFCIYHFEFCTLKIISSLNRSDEGEFIRIFEVCADGYAVSKSADLDADRLYQP